MSLEQARHAYGNGNYSQSMDFAFDIIKDHLRDPIEEKRASEELKEAFLIDIESIIKAGLIVKTEKGLDTLSDLTFQFSQCFASVKEMLDYEYEIRKCLNGWIYDYYEEVCARLEQTRSPQLLREFFKANHNVLGAWMLLTVACRSPIDELCQLEGIEKSQIKEIYGDRISELDSTIDPGSYLRDHGERLLRALNDEFDSESAGASKEYLSTLSGDYIKSVLTGLTMIGYGIPESVPKNGYSDDDYLNMKRYIIYSTEALNKVVYVNGRQIYVYGEKSRENEYNKIVNYRKIILEKDPLEKLPDLPPRYVNGEGPAVKTAPQPASQSSVQSSAPIQMGNTNASGNNGQGLAIASFVCGIVGLLLGFFASVAAIILFFVAKSKGNTSGLGITGLILGIIGLVIQGIFIFSNL